MEIASFSFLIYLIIVVFIYNLLPQKAKLNFLLLAGLFFYFCWHKWAPIFIILYALFCYHTALTIKKHPGGKKFELLYFVGVSILIFTFFRYTNLLNISINSLLDLFETGMSFVFPLGFSYYMFKCISYTIDVYQDKIEPETRFRNFLTYVCWFPELSMGPITRAIDFLPQINKEKKFEPTLLYEGFILILWGFAKKLLLAERMASLIKNSSYVDGSINNGLTWFIVSFAFLIELYLDFSAYTDISVGISHMLGYEVKHNFNAPFFATSISDYWRRWHISLSSWLADYVFTPLQFIWRKYGIYASVFSAIITFLLIGMWHGIELHYIIYGLFMGVLVAFDAVFSKQRKSLKKKLPAVIFAPLGIILTLCANILLIIFFHMPKAEDAFKVIFNYILDFKTWSIHTGLGIYFYTLLIVSIIITVFSHLIESNRQGFFTSWFKIPLVIRWVVYYCIIFATLIYGIYGPVYNASDFIYMSF